jgi:hypothetical protein
LLAFHAEIGDRAGDAVVVRDVVNRYLETHSFVWGFGTPFRPHDERLTAFEACMEKRGRDILPHYRTMLALAEAVREVRRAQPNMGIALAAVLLDMGLSPEQIGALVTALMQHMFFAHGVEAAAASDGTLRKLPDAYLAYAGRDARQSPRALAAREYLASAVPPRRREGSAM